MLNLKTQVVQLVKDQDGRGRGLVAAKEFKHLEPIALYAKKKSTITDFKKPIFHVKGQIGYIAEGMAAFINDPAPATFIHSLHKCKTVAEVDSWALKYPSESKGTNSAITIAKGVALAVATLRIEAKSPIWSSYGASYWIDEVAMSDDVEPQTRMACLMWLVSKEHYPLVAQAHDIWVFYNPLTQSLVTNSFYKDALPEWNEDRADETHQVLMRAIGLDGGIVEWLQVCESVLPSAPDSG